jgi:hypothetical protein
MNINIPPISVIQAELKTLNYGEVKELARLSGVPFTTIWNIRGGLTENPGTETCRKFCGLIADAKTNLAAAQGA